MDDAAVDRFVADALRGTPIACRRGCSWCCHQLVVLTCRADGRRILAAARSRLTAAGFRDFEQRVRGQAAAIARIGHEAAEGLRWTCPLLRAGACLAYEVRPVACRTVVSPDPGCCRAMMEADRFDALSPAHQRLATDIGDRSFRLQVAINDRRPIDGPVELRQLLVELLDEEAASRPQPDGRAPPSEG